MVKKILLLLFLALGHTLLAGFADAKLMISEVMYDLEGADSGREWTEIVNTGPETITVISGTKGYRFFDGSNHLINDPVLGNLTLAPGGFLVLANDPVKFQSDNPNFSGNLSKSAFSLKNTAATLKIIDENGVVLDEFSYSSSVGAAGNGKTLGLVSGVLRETEPTPGNQNRIAEISGPAPATPEPTPQTSSSQTTQTSSTPTASPASYSTAIVINEFMPNPEGEDAENEWIELFNEGETGVDLSGWKLKSAGSKEFSLSAVLEPKQFLVIRRHDSNITVTNDGDTLELFWPNGNVAFAIEYSGAAPSGQSFNRFGKNDWRWTSQPTPGAPNIAAIATPAKTSVPPASAKTESQGTIILDTLPDGAATQKSSLNIPLFIITGIILGVISAIIVIKITRPL